MANAENPNPFEQAAREARGGGPGGPENPFVRAAGEAGGEEGVEGREGQPIAGRRGKPRVEVYLGMIPELKAKVEAKGLRVTGMVRKVDVDSGEEIQTPDFEKMNDVDQVLLATLNELNRAVQQNTEKWSLAQRRKIEWGEARLLEIIPNGEDNIIYKRLHTLIPNLDNLHQYVHRFWLTLRGGDASKMSELLSEAGAKLDNGIVWSLLEDPVIETAFHELKGVQDISNDFTVGATRTYKDPNIGQESEYTIRGGTYGGAEKMGHFLRWITGWGFYDSPPDAAINAYMAYKIRWWPEYALGKGWYDNIRQIMYEATPDGQIILHTISAFPDMWHAPNVAPLVEYYMGFMGGKGARVEMAAVRTDDLDWKDKARLMCWYSKSDVRILNRIDMPYRREEFERANETEQRRMFENALVAWQQLSPEQRKTIIQNNLLNDRYILDQLDSRGRPVFQGGRIVANGFDERRIKFGVKPVIDLDAKRADGSYRINLADILWYSTHGAGEWTNNEFTYEGYAAKTEALWEKIAKEGVIGGKELFTNLLRAGDPSEAYRQLYGKVNPETKEREGTLQKWMDETGWIMESYSDMFLYGLWVDRMKGLRIDEVAVPVNEYTRMGLFQKFYAEEFDDTGNDGHDWRGMYRNPIRQAEGKVAKILGKFGSRKVWVNYLRSRVFDGTRFANLPDEKMFQALVAFAGFKIIPNSAGSYEGTYVLRERCEYQGRVIQKGRVAQYFDFELDKKREWGREMLGDDFDEVMVTMGKGVSASGTFTALDEASDEEKTVFQLIDAFRTATYDNNPANRIAREFGLPLSYYSREVGVNEILRDYLRYGIGRYQGQYALDQLATVSDYRDYSPKAVLGQPEEVTRQVEINGRRLTLQAGNIHLVEHEIKNEKEEVVQTILQPEFPLFMWGDKRYLTKGVDKVWSLMQGTGELFPGMEKKITPLYRHYDKNRYMNFILSIYADPLFELKVLQNAGQNWEDHFGFFYVCNPRKIETILDELRNQGIETDMDWIGPWKRRLNVANPNRLKDYDGKMREMRVLSAEVARKKDDVTEADIADFSNFVVSGYKIIESSGAITGVLKRVLGARTWTEFRARIYATAPGGVAATPLAVPLIVSGNPLNIALGVLIEVGAGIGSSILIGGDAGIDETKGYEKELEGGISPIGFLRNVRYTWKSGLGLMGDRVRHRSYEVIARGKAAIWDDIVPKEVPVGMFKDGHSKLQTKPPQPS